MGRRMTVAMLAILASFAFAARADAARLSSSRAPPTAPAVARRSSEPSSRAATRCARRSPPPTRSRTTDLIYLQAAGDYAGLERAEPHRRRVHLRPRAAHHDACAATAAIASSRSPRTSTPRCPRVTISGGARARRLQAAATSSTRASWSSSTAASPAARRRSGGGIASIGGLGVAQRQPDRPQHARPASASAAASSAPGQRRDTDRRSPRRSPSISASGELGQGGGIASDGGGNDTAAVVLDDRPQPHQQRRAAAPGCTSAPATRPCASRALLLADNSETAQHNSLQLRRAAARSSRTESTNFEDGTTCGWGPATTGLGVASTLTNQGGDTDVLAIPRPSQHGDQPRARRPAAPRTDQRDADRRTTARATPARSSWAPPPPPIDDGAQFEPPDVVATPTPTPVTQAQATPAPDAFTDRNSRPDAGFPRVGERDRRPAP